MNTPSIVITNLNALGQCEAKVDLQIIGDENKLDFTTAKFVCLKDRVNILECSLNLHLKSYVWSYKNLKALHDNLQPGSSFNTKSDAKFCITVDTKDKQKIKSPEFYLKSTLPKQPVQSPVVQNTVFCSQQPRTSSPPQSASVQDQISAPPLPTQTIAYPSSAAGSPANSPPRASISTVSIADQSSSNTNKDKLVPFDRTEKQDFKCLCLLGEWNSSKSDFTYSKIEKPSSEMQCRVLRIFHQYATMFIKVQYKIEKIDEKAEAVWKKHLLTGFTFENEKYYGLGYSNSGVKDSSLWCLNVKCPLSREKIYSILGEFTGIKEVGKLAKRVGASFGNSRPLTAIKLHRDIDFGDIEDNKTTDYNFTDGCGVISSSMIDTLLKPEYPDFYTKICAIQIRLHGYKGVLVRYPDEFVKQMAKKSNLDERVQILLRGSMKKFMVPNETLYPYMDLCNIATAIPAGYNRQMTSILEYGMNFSDNEVKYNFIKNRLIGLVKNSIEPDNKAFTNCNYALRLFNNNNSRDAIIRYLLMSAGQDEVVQEPYIRDKIFKAVFDKYWFKIRDGKVRTQDPQMIYLMGAVDETGKLKKNQVFVSFGNGEDPTILTQTVLIARNPCSMASDVRKVEAVYCEELSHLRNVIIFPQPSNSEKNNARPLADECSGGDFDGDLYACIFNNNIVSAFTAQQTVTNFGKQLKREFEVDNVAFEESEWDGCTSTIVEKIFEQLVNYKKKSQVGKFEYNFRLNFEKNRNMNSDAYITNAKRYALELEGSLFKKDFPFDREVSLLDIEANSIHFKHDYKKAKEAKPEVDSKQFVLKYDLRPQSKESLNEIMFCETLKFLQNKIKEVGQTVRKESSFITLNELHQCWDPKQYNNLYEKYNLQAKECYTQFNNRIRIRIENKESQKTLTEEEELKQEQFKEMEVKNFVYRYEYFFPVGSVEREYREKYFIPNQTEGVNELQLKAGLFYLYNIEKSTDPVKMMPYALAFDYLVACRHKVKHQLSGSSSQQSIQPLIIDPQYIGSFTKRV